MQGFLIAALVVTLIAAVADVRSGEIPQWLTGGTVLVGTLAHVIYAAARLPGSVALAEGGYSILGVIACAFVPLVLYRQDAIGGGDVKLFAAIGALLHPRIGFEAQMYAFFAAGLLAPARLAYEGKLFRTLKNVVLIASNPILPKSRRREIEPTLMTWFRFGPAIFLGTGLAVYLHWRTQ